MCSSSDNRIKICFLYCKFYSYSMKSTCLYLFQYISNHLAMGLFSKQDGKYSGSFAPMKSGWIYILADQNGAQESCLELKRKIFLKYFRPYKFEMRYKQVSFGLELSANVNCLKQLLFLNFCKNHIPASITDDAFTLYPKCGVEKVIRVWNFPLRSRSLGKAALMINPPRLCPINEICSSAPGGKN